MIDQAEVEAWAARFGVSPEQILRDHLISHVLRVIADDPIGRDVIFFGGTSLCRTRLREWRVSEDIDLWAELSVASRLDPLVREKLEQEHPVAAFERTGRGTWRLTTEQRIELQIQVVDYGTEYEKCVPVASTEVDLRYSDLPRTVRMRVPTAPGFVAMKYLALVDRSAPRDLLDLWGLAEAGHLDAESIDVIR